MFYQLLKEKLDIEYLASFCQLLQNTAKLRRFEELLSGIAAMHKPSLHVNTVNSVYVTCYEPSLTMLTDMARILIGKGLLLLLLLLSLLFCFELFLFVFFSVEYTMVYHTWLTERERK